MKRTAASGPALLLLPAICVILFILNGLSVIPYPGIQNDEAFFSVGVYQPGTMASILSLFKHRVPMMHLSYLGTLKTWLYAPILRFWPPDRNSVRTPVLGAAVGTILFFYLLVRRAAGPWAALIALALLAADPAFLLTNVFDWGPVAFQFLLTTAGCYCLLRFAQAGGRRWLSSGFFLFGLAVWNKALFGWTLAALVLAALLLFRAELARLCSRRNVGLAVLWFSIGAFPFLRYNLGHPLATFRENAGFSLAGLAPKAQMMLRTLDGSGLFDYMVWDEPVRNPLPPETTVERFSLGVGDVSGQPHRTVLPWLAAASLLIIPFIPFRRAAIFAAIVFLLTWAQMVVAKGAGTAMHHTVLAYPWPHFLIGATLAGVAGRLRRSGTVVLAAAVLATAVSGLLVINQYRVQFFRDGAMRSWTDAIFPLSALLSRLPAGQFILVDWGLADNLHLLHEGRLPLRWDLLDDQAETRQILAGASNIYIGHTPGHEQFAGIHEKLHRIAAEEGFHRELLHVVRDRNERAVYEVFRFRRAGPPPGRARQQADSTIE